MNARGPSSMLAAIALMCGALAAAADSRFGELPQGSRGTVETHGVAAEICRDHVFDPQAARVTLPQGYRLTLVSEAAGKNPSLQALLQRHPQLHAHAVGVLCFLAADRMRVEGAAQDITPVQAAFWWAAASGPRHADMRGKAQWVQLGSWYAASTPTRAAVLKVDPMAEFVDLEVKQRGPNDWALRLALANEVVTAEVRSAEVAKPSTAPQPGYMSVPLSGPGAGYFNVYTYAGHVHRAAQGSWRAKGTGVFSQAFSLAGEDEAFDTAFQEGWVSRSGLYPFASR